MKKTIAIALLAGLASSAFAQVQVSGYTKSNGTYVQPHMRSAPDNTTLNNYSTKGNVNPYTGEAGTKNPEPQAYGLQPAQQARPAQQVQQPLFPQPVQQPKQQQSQMNTMPHAF